MNYYLVKIFFNKIYNCLSLKRSHIRQTIMDVIFGKKLEVPMYQNLKIKSEPVILTVSEIQY